MEALLGTPGQLHASFVPPEHKGLKIWPKRLDSELESLSFSTELHCGVHLGAGSS